MGRTSTIDLLPDEVIEKFKGWVKDGAVNIDEVCRRTNAQLEEMGLGELTVSRAAVGRKAKNINDEMKRIGEEMRAAKASREDFYDRFGDDISDGGKFLVETLQGFIFKLNMTLHKFDDDAMSVDDVFLYSKIVKNLTGAIAQTEEALSKYTKREAEIRKQATEEALATAEEAIHAGGTTAEQAARLKEMMGMRT